MSVRGTWLKGTGRTRHGNVGSRRRGLQCDSWILVRTYRQYIYNIVTVCGRVIDVYIYIWVVSFSVHGCDRNYRVCVGKAGMTAAVVGGCLRGITITVSYVETGNPTWIPDSYEGS